ncbi:hypothetical protein [Bilophila sp. 4_1_30]|uniref:hypothetical protein n=1 Tax=Bilophila sp. 4_1_30 TaxID=693988 RepID=UPI0012F50728|nr:hypothetical protein [Bilophila sp. 4_1_30]
MPDPNVILLPVKELIWLGQISFLSGYSPHKWETNKYPYAQILLEEVLKGENITVVYTQMGSIDKNNETIPVKEEFIFRLDTEDNSVIEEPYCPISLKKELLPIINDRIKPFMQHLYSLETETQADVENLKYAYITELETENKNLKMQLEEIQVNESAAQQEGGTPNLTPAQRAAQAKSEKSLAAWKKVFPAMMQVYHRCMVEGEKPRQAPDFYAMFNELNAELTDTQFKYFCSCLPKEYKDTEGGKPGKVCPPYNRNIIEYSPIQHPLNIVYDPLNTVHSL